MSYLVYVGYPYMYSHTKGKKRVTNPRVDKGIHVGILYIQIIYITEGIHYTLYIIHIFSCFYIFSFIRSIQRYFFVDDVTLRSLFSKRPIIDLVLESVSSCCFPLSSSSWRHLANTRLISS